MVNLSISSFFFSKIPVKGLILPEGMDIWSFLLDDGAKIFRTSDFSKKKVEKNILFVQITKKLMAK